MRCEHCGFTSPFVTKHCGGCGKALSQIRRCSCGFRNPSEFSFCGDCGKRLKQAPRSKSGKPVTSDTRHASSIIQKLDCYYRSQGIHPEEFRCKFRASCSAGCKRRFTEARASLVGQNYAGLVIVSLDPGKGFPRIEDRTFDQVQAREFNSDPKKWRIHWRETHALVEALLGRPSRGAFAHVNAAKCTQNKPGNKQADPHLFENCRGYLKKELAILEPRVIVTQGVKAHTAFEPIANATPIDKFRSITADGAFWIRAYHPGARKSYWDQKRNCWEAWAEWIKGGAAAL